MGFCFATAGMDRSQRRDFREIIRLLCVLKGIVWWIGYNLDYWYLWGYQKEIERSKEKKKKQQEVNMLFKWGLEVYLICDMIGEFHTENRGWGFCRLKSAERLWLSGCDTRKKKKPVACIVFWSSEFSLFHICFAMDMMFLYFFSPFESFYHFV